MKTVYAILSEVWEVCLSDETNACADGRWTCDAEDVGHCSILWIQCKCINSMCKLHHVVPCDLAAFSGS